MGGPDDRDPRRRRPAWADEVRTLAAARRGAAGAQLPAAGDPGRRRPRRRLARAVPDRGARAASTIVFCGVHFMAETAKILAPDKTVLIPDAAAGCSLADSITADQLRAWKAEHPGAVVVVLRQHHRRGEGRDRHLLHLVQRRRGGRLDAGRPRGPVPARPVPRRARPAGHRPGQHPRLGGRVPRARRDQPRDARRAGRGPPRRRAVHPPGVRLRDHGALPRRRGCGAGRPHPDPLTGGMVDAAAPHVARQVLVATEIGMLHQLRRATPDVAFRGGEPGRPAGT